MRYTCLNMSYYCQFYNFDVGNIFPTTNLTLSTITQSSFAQTLEMALRKWAVASLVWICGAHSMFACSQWETALLYNDVSHWLGASLESAHNWAGHWTSNIRISNVWNHKVDVTIFRSQSFKHTFRIPLVANITPECLVSCIECSNVQCPWSS